MRRSRPTSAGATPAPDPRPASRPTHRSGPGRITRPRLRDEPLVAKAGDRYRRISRLIEAVATVLMIGLTVGAFVGSASLFPTYATSRVLDFLLALIVGCV